jgi:hypothetical protein
MITVWNSGAAASSTQSPGLMAWRCRAVAGITMRRHCCTENIPLEDARRTIAPAVRTSSSLSSGCQPKAMMRVRLATLPDASTLLMSYSTEVSRGSRCKPISGSRRVGSGEGGFGSPRAVTTPCAVVCPCLCCNVATAFRGGTDPNGSARIDARCRPTDERWLIIGPFMIARCTVVRSPLPTRKSRRQVKIGEPDADGHGAAGPDASAVYTQLTWAYAASHPSLEVGSAAASARSVPRPVRC